MEQYGKLPPQAVELEESILGSCMIYKDVYSNIALKLNSDSFYKEAHQKIFKAIQELDNENIVIDILSVTQSLKKSGELESVGGGYYIAQLTNTATSNNNFNANIIKQKYIARELIRITSEIQEKAFDENEDIKDVLDYNEALMASLYDHVSSSNKMAHISGYTKEAMNELERRAKNFDKGITEGIPTPLNALNRLIGGWQKNNLVILAARPGMGKTAFALAFSKTAAENNSPVCIFSLEMSSIRLTDRIITANAGVDPERYKRGELDKGEWSKIEKSNNEISKLPIYLDDSPYVSLNHIKSVSRMKHKNGECGMIIIDYLQLINADSKQGYNREQEVSMMSRGLKGLAKELDVPVMLLCQLSRDVEKRGGDKRPQLSDLRESGAIEQDADIVMFPFRPSYYDITPEDDKGNSLENYGELLVKKHREGAQGDVPFWHNKNITKIKDYDIDYFEGKDAEDATENIFNNDDIPQNNEFDEQPF